jgi:branched-chain amino acid transport system ATP-binding protein
VASARPRRAGGLGVTTSDREELLVVRDLAKRFGGVDALRNLSFTVRRGEILSIIGPNGAGKTTLFNVMTGFLRPDQGTVDFLHRKITGTSPEVIARLGFVRTFQASRVFPTMSVVDNVLAAALACAPSRRQALTRVRDALDHFGSRLHGYAERPAGTLSFANRRRVEIARALACHPVLLALDEPTAGMNPAETQEMMSLIVALRRAGITIVVIEHDMTVVMGISDRIVVLNHGELLMEGTPDQVWNNPRVVEAYLGGEPASA